MAVQQLAAAICDHLQTPNGRTPLVVACHGPPGVGKSFTHLVAASALYKKADVAGSQCYGKDCPGYKVMQPSTPAPCLCLCKHAAMPAENMQQLRAQYMLLLRRDHSVAPTHARVQVLSGLDFRSEDEQEQHALLKKQILDHVKAHHTSMLVIEEYDKLSCQSRQFLRQFIENTASPDVSLGRSATKQLCTSIVMLNNLLTLTAQVHHSAGVKPGLHSPTRSVKEAGLRA